MNHLENAPRSWVSLKALEELTDPKNTYRIVNSSSKASSITGSPSSNNISINTELIPSTSNKSLCFKPFQDSATAEALKTQIQFKESEIQKLETKYQSETSQLNKLLLELRDQLEESRKQTNYYKDSLEDLHESYCMKIQCMQARHEKKLQKSKQEFEHLFSNMQRPNSFSQISNCYI